VSNSTIADAMLTEFHTLSPHDSLAKAIQLTLAGSQKDFPVGDDKQFQGVLTQSLLLSSLQQQGQEASVGSIKLANIKTVSREIPIQQLLEQLQSDQTHMVAVTDAGKIVGIANLDNVLELIKIHQALTSRNSLKA
jgi:CBS domain containing-hemolysin-like protein